MVFNKTNWIALTVALVFAILQVLQPFIHAHLNADHPIQNIGFHVAADHEEILQAHPAKSEHAVAVPHASHTIFVESGIKQEADSLLTPNIIALILISFYLAITLHLTSQQHPYSSSCSYQSLRRRLPASRAPPQY